ncbi:MAG: hypothetical protein A3C82_01180 [Candidatus Wildermuthbacteria bacterium RIFCSPHIGHO2_02_FULL_47_12]|uniref:R3H domain-containing protein n=1 Tax=Candidatus Wildermuthbacteria bacterium RIFCSPHIGHO2_02_FULL_47_12 TaxID=1802451 RepID=A0A1G2R3T1_9BACT|nr:MAG: hypothetical protein A3C82_01180 [Candidatus Wildermuthbacteria bacterium RIFCSPHIGHO2_02_FULL_47_12]
MTKESLDTIERVAREFLGKLGADGDMHIESKQEGEVALDVTLQEPQLLIGEKGQTLFEIAHILKALVRRKVAEPVRIILDINDYQKNKEQYLRELARTAADEVALFKKEKELPAMTPGERRIVHLELAERQDVVSESVGEGLDRRVVIKVRTGSSGESAPGL